MPKRSASEVIAASKKSRTEANSKGTKVPKNIQRYVKMAMHRNIENKRFVFYASNPILAGSSTAVPYALALLPSMSQGTGKAQRIGNEITIRSAKVSGQVWLNGYNATTNPIPAPIVVKMWVVACKVANPPAINTIATWGNFFDTGNSAVGFQGNLLDTCLPVNNDFWTVYATRQFTLGTTATNTLLSTGVVFDNNQFSRPFSIDFSKVFKKIKYNDGVANTPTNHNLYLVVQTVPAGNTSAEAHTICSITNVVDINYEDA